MNFFPGGISDSRVSILSLSNHGGYSVFGKRKYFFQNRD